MMVRNLLTMLAELIVFVMIDIIMLVAMDFSPSSVQIVAMVFMNLSFAVLIISIACSKNRESLYLQRLNVDDLHGPGCGGNHSGHPVHNPELEQCLGGLHNHGAVLRDSCCVDDP